MAPPISVQIVSKRTVNFLIIFNILVALGHLCSVLLTFNTYLFLDVINKPLQAAKWNTTVIICTVLGSYFASTERGNGIKIPSVVKGVLLFVVCVCLFHTLAVLYGAPLTQTVAETFHFSLLLSAASSIPPSVILGLNLNSWIRVYAHKDADLGPELVVYVTTICSIMGAWLGAFPIPLDWDRPWQVWPVSCLIGTLLGYDLGLIVSAGILYYKYHVTQKSKTI